MRKLLVVAAAAAVLGAVVLAVGVVLVGRLAGPPDRRMESRLEDLEGVTDVTVSGLETRGDGRSGRLATLELTLGPPGAPTRLAARGLSWEGLDRNALAEAGAGTEAVVPPSLADRVTVERLTMDDGTELTGVDVRAPRLRGRRPEFDSGTFDAISLRSAAGVELRIEGLALDGYRGLAANRLEARRVALREPSGDTVTLASVRADQASLGALEGRSLPDDPEAALPLLVSAFFVDLLEISRVETQAGAESGAIEDLVIDGWRGTVIPELGAASWTRVAADGAQTKQHDLIARDVTLALAGESRIEVGEAAARELTEAGAAADAVLVEDLVIEGDELTRIDARILGLRTLEDDEAPSLDLQVVGERDRSRDVLALQRLQLSSPELGAVQLSGAAVGLDFAALDAWLESTLGGAEQAGRGPGALADASVAWLRLDTHGTGLLAAVLGLSAERTGRDPKETLRAWKSALGAKVRAARAPRVQRLYDELHLYLKAPKALSASAYPDEPLPLPELVAAFRGDDASLERFLEEAHVGLDASVPAITIDLPEGKKLKPGTMSVMGRRTPDPWFLLQSGLAQQRAENDARLRAMYEQRERERELHRR